MDNKNKQIVYLVQFDYSTDDCEGIDIYLYKLRQNAIKKMKSLILDEIKFYKDEYEHIEKDLELDTNIEDKDAYEYFWNMTCKNNFYIHTFIDLKEKEVE